MTILEIKNLIKSKKPNIDSKDLEYFTNYFYGSLKKGVIPQNISLDKLISNTLKFASKIVFYDENSKIYQKEGKDVKGYCDNIHHTIYVRVNLEEPLREIVVYHEIHHACQTNPANYQMGINQTSNMGRLIMEAQTAYIAEEIYKIVHNVEFEERLIPTSNLRMLDGGIVTSSLHSYELYDNLLTKLAIIFEVPKDYFVSLNYLYKDNLGFKLLEERYKIVKNKYQFPYDFKLFMLYFDYVYCVDLLCYTDNPSKDIILNGGETSKYEIYPRMYLPISLKGEQVYLSQIDGNIFLALVENDGNYQEFAKYIIDNKQRELAKEYIATIEEGLREMNK